MRLVIDPGHGGEDPGCVHNGIQEKDLALELGLRLNEAFDWKAKNTRCDDSHPTFAHRGSLSHNFDAELVLVLHANAVADPHPGYFSTFHLLNDLMASEVGGAILAAAPRELAPKKAPITALSSDWTMHATNVLAPHRGHHPVLVEAGFLSNPKHAEFLKTDAGKDAVVAALLAGVRKAEEWTSSS